MSIEIEEFSPNEVKATMEVIMQKIQKLTIVFLSMAIVLLMTGCKPLYVGTMGADVYHMPDCKYAEQSLDKYGGIKRVNYHSTLHKNLSGRKPCPKCNP